MISCPLFARPRLLAWAIAAALAASGAAAAPTLSARPAFSPIRSGDAACAIVAVENDGQARRVILRGERRDAGRSAASKPAVEVALDLQPGARKLLMLPLPPDPLPRALLSLSSDGEILAIAAMQLDWASDDEPLLAVVAPAPPTLAASARRTLHASLGEVTALPPNPDAWPQLDALAWDRPRAADLTPEIAAALRRHVVSGGRVVIGLGPEEAGLFEREDLRDFLPARVERGPGLELRLVDIAPFAEELAAEGALVVPRGLGEVVLVPHALDDVAEASWPLLLDVEPPPVPVPGEPRKQRRVRWNHVRVPDMDIREGLVPKPPWIAASALLTAFLLAAVPLDGWLTRRSLRRGRRGRGGMMRYPAIVLVATGASFAVAERSSGGSLRTWRLDVVDVGADGEGIGSTMLFAARGSGGPLEIDAGGASITSFVEERGGMGALAGLRAALHGHADAATPVSRATVTILPWQRLRFNATWTPGDIPRIEVPANPCDPLLLPESDGAVGMDCRGRLVRPLHAPAGPLAHRDTGEVDEEIRPLLDPSQVGDPGQPSLILAWRRRLGPPMTVDGRSTDEGPSFTLVRYRPQPAQESP